MATDTNSTGITTHLQTRAHSKLHELLINQLQELLWNEKKLTKAIGKMQFIATSDQLKETFRSLHVQTKEQARRLEQVFDALGEKTNSSKCASMAGIIDEMHDVIDDTEEGSFQRDVALIIAAQKAAHYQIAAYGSLVQLAKTLQHTHIQQPLSQSLQEHKDADITLSDIAEKGVNELAAREGK